jgi:UDP-N-acetylglucosamine 2-epimerase
MIKSLSSVTQEYDAIIGINIFNKGWNAVYRESQENIFGVEYCWNEIYNTNISVSGQDKDFQTSARIFCNSSQTFQMIKKNRESDKNLLNMGSPWFELLSKSKSNNRDKKIVFLAPHNSMYRFDVKLKNKVEAMLQLLREFCDKNKTQLILKDRRKYQNSYADTIKWDSIVYDDHPFDHIATYKDASLVISFCSSGINEFSFLEVPYICVCPEYQKQLNPQIHKEYYSGDIFDNIHCSQISSKKMTNFAVLKDSIKNLFSSKKSWKHFQNKHFSGNHIGSSKKIVDFIEKEIEKNN